MYTSARPFPPHTCLLVTASPNTRASWSPLPRRSQACIFNAIDIPIESFSSSSVHSRYGKRDLRLPDDHARAESELLRHVAYHLRTALHPAPAVAALGGEHRAYVDAVRRAFEVRGDDPTELGFASDPDFVRRLETMLHDDAQHLATVRGCGWVCVVVGGGCTGGQQPCNLACMLDGGCAGGQQPCVYA